MPTPMEEWQREARRLAGACKSYGKELADLRARLAEIEAERDRLRGFTERVYQMPGICTCEHMSTTSRRIGLKCLRCMAAAALAAPADQPQQPPPPRTDTDTPGRQAGRTADPGTSPAPLT